MNVEDVNSKFGSLFCDKEVAKTLESVTGALDGSITYFVQYGYPFINEKKKVSTNYLELEKSVVNLDETQFKQMSESDKNTVLITSLIKGVNSLMKADCLDITEQTVAQQKQQPWN